MQERRALRRVAAILFHRRAGFSANGMGVWKVPEERILEIGPRMAAFRGISHCYQRPTYADWPYSVFTMAHGRSKEECDAILDPIAEETGIERARATLYSSTEFKKIRLLYFTDDSQAVGSGARARPRPSVYARRSTAARRRQLAGARDARDRPRPALHRARRGRRADRRRRQPLRRLGLSWGPLIAGHAHPDVVAAVTPRPPRAARASARPPRPRSSSPREVVERVPRAEMVRMTSSGTEATMSALRLARAATGRDRS